MPRLEPRSVRGPKLHTEGPLCHSVSLSLSEDSEEALETAQHSPAKASCSAPLCLLPFSPANAIPCLPQRAPTTGAAGKDQGSVAWGRIWWDGEQRLTHGWVSRDGAGPAPCEIAVDGHTAPAGHGPSGGVRVRARALTVPGTCTLCCMFLNKIADLLRKGSLKYPVKGRRKKSGKRMSWWPQELSYTCNLRRLGDLAAGFRGRWREVLEVKGIIEGPGDGEGVRVGGVEADDRSG